MTEKSLELLVEGMSEEELYEAGKMMGHTLSDSLISNYNLPANGARTREVGFSILKQCGMIETSRGRQAGELREPDLRYPALKNQFPISGKKMAVAEHAQG